MKTYRKPRVYVVNDGGHDFSPAMSRGELVILTRGSVNVFATDRLLQELKDKLNESHEDDFLLTSGNGLVSCLAHTFMMLKHGRVNLLIYSFKNKDYELRNMTLRQYTSEV